MKLKHWSIGLALVIGFLAPAFANSYPTRPITLIVAYAAGGSNDITARVVGAKMSALLGKSVVIENIGGAGGEIGATRAARAQPDGYTLILAAGGHAIAHGLKKTLSYDLINDFEHISVVNRSPYMLLINPNALKVNSVAELIAYAKANPGKLNYASSGIGAPPHLLAELFQKLTGTSLVQVAYRGEQPAVTAVVAGEVPMTFMGAGSTRKFIDSGILKALAVTSKDRLDILPDVPSLHELGVTGVDISTWFALLAPKGTPREIIDILNKAVVAALKEDEVKSRFAEAGMVAVGNSPEECAQFVKAEVERFTAIIESAGIPKQ